MPTSDKEADKIIELCSRYGVGPQTLLHLSRDLHEQVGQVSDNWSVRETMRMLYDRAIDVAIKLCPADTNVDDFMVTMNVKRPGGPYTEPNGDRLTDGITFDYIRAMHLTLYWLIVIGHVAVWGGLLLSCFMCLLYQPLYIAMPVISFCVYLLTTNHICPVTCWENCIRRKLGWPQVTHFTHWYIVCPLFHGRTCDKKCSAIRVGPG
jgi:hypothetical protein